MTDTRLPDLVRRIGIFSWATIGVVVLTLVTAYLIIEGRVILAPLLLAVVLIYILNPLVTRLNRLGIHRLLGAAIGYLLIIAVLVFVGFLVIPSIVDQAVEFAKEFPNLYDDTASELEDLASSIGFDNVVVWSYDDLVGYISDPDHQDQLVGIAVARLRGVTSVIFEVVLAVLLGPAIAFYLLIDLPQVRRRAIGMFPEASRAEAVHVGSQVNTAIGGFLRGQLLVALVVGVLLAVGYRIIGLDFYLLIGLVGGLLNIVPFVGPWVGGALGVILALATADLSTAVAAAIVALAVQQLDNHLISPSVLRATVRLHPAVTLSVLVLFGAVAGAWGVIIAVPLAATLKILVGHWWRTRVLHETWEQASDELIEIHEPRRRRIGRLRDDRQLTFEGVEVLTEEGEPDDEEA